MTESYFERVASYPLLDALLHRHSRRFARGMRLSSGPLAYASAHPSQPLTCEEQALLAFAACGFTGYALAELPYDTGGNIMRQFVSRTAASADALHNYSAVVIDDEGAWLIRRPQDLDPDALAQAIDNVQRGKIVEWYEQCRVRIADRRVEIPREPPFTLDINAWEANGRGSTLFLPVAELSASYINGLLYTFGSGFGGFAVDEHNGFRPAGITRFGRSRGGTLYDDPKEGRTSPLRLLEQLLYEFATVELGGMMQNLGLMTQALGLGGFAHYAAHPSAWLSALGFRMEPVPVSRVAGMGSVLRFAARATGRDFDVPTAVGLERGGQVLLTSYSPPYYASMERAVLAYVADKYAEGRGAFRNGGRMTGWRNGKDVQAGIPRYSDEAIAATVAYCEYVYKRYGRVPAASGPFHTLLAYQAHHLDVDFYDRFYRDDALSVTQREHDQKWHPETVQSDLDGGGKG